MFIKVINLFNLNEILHISFFFQNQDILTLERIVMTFQITNGDNSLYAFEGLRIFPIDSSGCTFSKARWGDRIKRWTLTFNPCSPAAPHRREDQKSPGAH